MWIGVLPLMGSGLPTTGPVLVAHPADPTVGYSADAQARSIIGLIEELRLDRPVLGGHDIGSRVAQAVARQRPDLVRALVLTPPLCVSIEEPPPDGSPAPRWSCGRSSRG